MYNLHILEEANFYSEAWQRVNTGEPNNMLAKNIDFGVRQTLVQILPLSFINRGIFLGA